MKALLILLIWALPVFGQGVTPLVSSNITNHCETGNVSSTTTPTYGGNLNDRLYIVVATWRGDDDLTDFSDSGGLSWTEEIDICADDGQYAAHMFSAVGTLSNKTFTTELAGASATITNKILKVDSAHATVPLSDAHWEIVGGEGTGNPGSCPVADKDDTLRITIGVTAASGVDLMATWPINRGKVYNPARIGSWNNLQVTTCSSGGDAIKHTHVDTIGLGADQDLTISLTSIDDWVWMGAVIEFADAAGAQPTRRRVLFGTRRVYNPIRWSWATIDYRHETSPSGKSGATYRIKDEYGCDGDLLHAPRLYEWIYTQNGQIVAREGVPHFVSREGFDTYITINDMDRYGLLESDLAASLQSGGIKLLRDD